MSGKSSATILVANLGSTSYKYRVYRMGEDSSELLTKGGYERVTDHGKVIADSLEKLQTEEVGQLDGVGFKTVLGKNLSGCRLADDQVLAALEGFKEVAPAHNPAYAEGIRQFARLLPEVPRYALFETAFYSFTDPARHHYALPRSWREAGIRRYGFHGASHKFATERLASLAGRGDIEERVKDLYLKGPGNEPEGKPFRTIVFHLGGSSSITATVNGIAIGNTMGFSPQSGLPQNNRVGDLDSEALLFASRQLGIPPEECQRQLTKESGLLGLSGISNDMRDIVEAMDNGNPDARLAFEVFIAEAQRLAGGFLWPMGGVDAIGFTGGIGEHQDRVRSKILESLEPFGFALNPEANQEAKGRETALHQPSSTIKAWVIPANEELVVAREVARQLQTQNL